MVRVKQYHPPIFSWGEADTIQDGSTLDGVLAYADQRLYAQRRRNRPANNSSVATPTSRSSPRSRISTKRAAEMLVTGALALAIGAIVLSISGGNHALCGIGEGPTVVDCGLSNAVYDGGVALVAAGGVVLTVAVIAWAILRGTQSS